MRSRRFVILGVLAVFGLIVAAGNMAAGTIEDPNLFLGQDAVTSSNYGGNPDFAATHLTDGTTAVHIFNDGNTLNQAAIRNFGSTAISTLRFYDAGWGPRTPDSVSVYYTSMAVPTSFDPFIYYGTYALQTQPRPGGNGFTNPSSNAADIVGPNALSANYAEVSGLNIPYGTKSVWFTFPGVGGSLYGSALSEIQGFAPAIADANVLQNKAVVASNTYYTSSGAFNASFATDGTVSEQVFADPGNDQRLVVHGINSGFNLIRLWRDSETPRVPARALIKSSMSDTTSLDAANYDTTLTNLSSIVFNGAGYADISVNAPVGTESLFLDFGSSDSVGDPQNPYGVRIVELQAFNLAAAVPEPSTLALLSCGLTGLLAYAWRKRK